MCGFALLPISLLTVECALRAGPTEVILQSFDTDPGWTGRNHQPDPSLCVETVQDFGYSLTRNASGTGGRVAGEVGGRVSRSLTPASYARRIEPRTLENPLRASGRLAVTACEGGSGVLVGWFHSTSRGWRTPNSLVYRIDGDAGKFRVFFEYGTSTWKTGGGQTFEGDYQTTKDPLIPVGSTPHTWTLEYDPAGAGGAGEITFTLDGASYRAQLVPGHKEEGAIFDRFGILNQQSSGSHITIWLDDIVVGGEREDFASDPGWEGVGNRTSFRDCGIRDLHDFGYRPSSHAGGKQGEIGGRVWRVEAPNPERALSYGAPAGRLTLGDELEISGRISFRAGSADSAALIGWFNRITPIGAPPANFLGILIEGPSQVGHYFRPVLGTANDRKTIAPMGPFIRPDSKPHSFTLRYAPRGGAGHGRITVALDGEPVQLDLALEDRKGGAALESFGVLSWQRGGHHVEVYFDDLRYTVRR